MDNKVPSLRGPRVALRQRQATDTPHLLTLLQEPAVAQWWGIWDEARLDRELLSEDEFGWVITADDQFLGWVSAFPITDSYYLSVGIDIAIAGEFRRHAYASEVIRVLIEHFHTQGHHRFTIDPAADNEAAIRAYSKVGFKPVGVMRQYERRSDGTWRDNLLMDLLVDELVDPSS